MGATATFVKLFGTILQSSIWEQDSDTRVVWITLLALADPDGFVKASLGGLARAAAVSRDACQRAVDCLEAPEIESGTQDYAGRRIERVEGGWQLLNYKKYREIRTPDQLRNARRQARFREAHRGENVTLLVTPVTTITSPSASSSGEAGSSEEEDQAEKKPSVALTVINEQEAAVVAATEQRLTKEAALRVAAEVVFRYWRDRMGFDPARTVLTAKREQRIIARLKENHGDVSELLYCVDGALKDDWTMGRDARSTKPYNGTQTIFRDREKVEELVALVPKRDAQHPYLSNGTHP
jgi:hypothetical protein